MIKVAVNTTERDSPCKLTPPLSVNAADAIDDAERIRNAITVPRDMLIRANDDELAPIRRLVS